MSGPYGFYWAGTALYQVDTGLCRVGTALCRASGASPRSREVSPQTGMDFPSGGLGRGDESPPGALDPLRSLLHSISSSLSVKELSEMKFLCRDKIGKRKLDSVQSGQELFDILMEQQAITKDNLELLKKLLQHIKRRDLLSQVMQFEEGGPQALEDQPDEHERCRWIIINM